jgi:Lar family restriction alleviation protein
MELKPCPFCGGEAVQGRSFGFDSHGHLDEYYIYCFTCGAKGPAYDKENDILRLTERTVRKAADAWNRRANDATEE